VSGAKVSVIIPTYQRAHQVANSIRSALDQTHGDLEILVIDDGSTDGTREVVASIDDPRVSYHWQENGGLPAARNRGLDEATGDYIALLDSDDVWLPWKIAAQLAVLRAFPEAGMVWTDMTAVSPQGELLQERQLRHRYTAYKYLDRDRDFASRSTLHRIWPEAPAELGGATAHAGSVYEHMFLGNLAHDSTVLLTRERVEATGRFDTAFSAGYDFFLRAAERGPVAFLDTPSTLCTVGAEDSLSGSARRVTEALDGLAVTEKVIASGGAARLPDSLIRERLARSHHWIAAEQLPTDPRSARRHAGLVLRYGPLRDRRARRHALILYMLSLMPRRVAGQLRRLRRLARAPAPGSPLQAASS
jgi:GT2 family glycosyltransferase